MPKRSTPPRKLTAEVQRKLLDAIRAGNYMAVAARYAGISPRTLQVWMKRGRESTSGRFRKLYDAVMHAEAIPEVHAVATLAKLIEQQNLSGIIKFLERKYPRRWGTGQARARNAQQASNTRTKEPSHGPAPANRPNAPARDPHLARDPTLADPERAARILEALREIGYGRPHAPDAGGAEPA